MTVASRNVGEGKWTLLSLIGLATTAIISFTSAPLRIITVLGSIALVFSFVVAVDALWSWFNDEAVSGFTTTIDTLLILGSFIMISLGIIGEYIAKIYDEIKARPAYLIEDKQGVVNSHLSLNSWSSSLQLARFQQPAYVCQLIHLVQRWFYCLARFLCVHDYEK